MTKFKIHCVDENIKALPTVDTASGSIATFDTDMTEDLIEVVCNIQYSQASGTPTPVNPLPITVYTSLNLSHSGADTSNPNVTNIPFGQTVAKGTLNVTTGVLTITWGYVDLGILDWAYNSTYQLFRVQMVTKYKPDGLIACELYPYVGNYTNMTDKTMGYIFDTHFAIKDSTYGTDANAFKTAMNGIYAVYELVTPQEIQLSATQITALLNENNIWCDTNGDTSVKYILSVGKAISKRR